MDRMECSYCENGKLTRQWEDTCSRCGGDGNIYSEKAKADEEHTIGELEDMGEIWQCDLCQGTGIMIRAEIIRCYHCKGTGWIEFKGGAHLREINLGDYRLD